MKNKKIIIICIIVILVLIIAVGIYFMTKNSNSTTTGSNGIMSSNSNSKISWERSENIVTDNSYAVEEGVINTKNVSTKSLTKITLEQFVNKWSENAETNFLCYYNLENKVSNILDNNIRKGELFSSYETIYVKGVLPRF